MAKGYEAHQERLRSLALLGKDLARRAKSKCEVCLAVGVPLRPHEVPPAPAEPDLEHVILVCASCAAALDDPAPDLDPNRWRVLAETLWSETPAVQVSVIRLLRHLAKETDWARDTLEEAYLDDSLLAWADASGR
jgi:protein PhnA